MASSAPVRIGFIGTGFIASWQARAFRAQGAAIAGFAGRSAAAQVAEFGGRAWERWQDLVADPGVEAVLVGSVNPLHRPQIEACLRAGKPVLAEKPVAVDPADLAALTALARSTGVPLVPAHNFLHRPAVVHARRLLAEGRIGQVMHASFASVHTISPAHAGGWRGRLAESGGGALMDSGHHQVYQALALRGRPVSVSAVTSRLVLTGMEGEDQALVTLTHADGTTTSILQGWTTGHGGRLDGINLLGTAGAITIADKLVVDGTAYDDATGYEDSFAGQAKAFLDHLRGGAAPATLEDAADTLAVINLAYRSAKEGRTLPFAAQAARAAAGR
ncbi:MAG: Gfo/Idh/MocA family oxidoreductase [Planctomycetes bacterium]|nr:Gfo/Idh/MocA family oxidoreductase [Planctomycetota bacterium]